MKLAYAICTRYGDYLQLCFPVTCMHNLFMEAVMIWNVTGTNKASPLVDRKCAGFNYTDLNAECAYTLRCVCACTCIWRV